MRLNEIRDNPGAVRKRKSVGRGIGSGTGKQAGRGTKGQKARSGVSLLGFEGGQMPLYRRLPKRGFHNPFRGEFAEINLGQLQKAIEAGGLDPNQPITEDVLRASGLVKNRHDGVRLLANGEIKAKISIAVAGASKAAVEAVAKAGGQVTLPAPKAKPPTRGKKLKRQQAEKTTAKKSPSAEGAEKGSAPKEKAEAKKSAAEGMGKDAAPKEKAQAKGPEKKKDKGEA
jgi:large subunit ribosomal protein L15